MESVKMTLSEFNQLRLAQQASYLKQHGTYLTTRRDYYYTITLFSIDSFYAEIWVDTNEGSVFTIVAFKDINSLGFYVEELSVDELLAM